MTCHRFAMLLSAFAYLPLQVILPNMVTSYHNGHHDLVKSLVRKAKAITLAILAVGGALPVALANFDFANLSQMFGFSLSQLWIFFIIFLIFDRLGAYNVQMQTLNERVLWHVVNGASAGGAALAALIYSQHTECPPFLFRCVYQQFWFTSRFRSTSNIQSLDWKLLKIF